MIAIHKRSNMLYPVTHIFFPQSPSEVGTIGPLSVVQCLQVSQEIKECFENQAIYLQSYYTLLSNLREPADTLWRHIHHSRQCKIQQAKKLPIHIRLNEYSLPELYRFILSFYRAKELYQPRCNNFAQFCAHCDVLTAMWEDKMAVVHVILKDAPYRAMAYYSCYNVSLDISNADRGALNSYLHWWELQHYQAKGFYAYDWGGVTLDKTASAYGVTQFKQKFGGELIQEWNMLLLGNYLRPLWPMINRVLESMGKGLLNWDQVKHHSNQSHYSRLKDGVLP